MTIEGQKIEKLTQDIFTGKTTTRYYSDFDKLSQSFVENATGETPAILNAKGISKESTYLRKEVPQSRKNPNMNIVEYKVNGNSIEKVGVAENITVHNSSIIRKIDNFVEKITYPIATSGYLNSKVLKDESVEGGITLKSSINTVILIDNSTEIGSYKQIYKSYILYIILNEFDLPRVNGEFLKNITNGNSNTKFENKEVKLKTRNEVAPNEKRKQRGL